MLIAIRFFLKYLEGAKRRTRKNKGRDAVFVGSDQS